MQLNTLAVLGLASLFPFTQQSMDSGLKEVFVWVEGVNYESRFWTSDVDTAINQLEDFEGKRTVGKFCEETLQAPGTFAYFSEARDIGIQQKQKSTEGVFDYKVSAKLSGYCTLKSWNPNFNSTPRCKTNQRGQQGCAVDLPY